MGYKYRDPLRTGQPVFTATDKRVHELEQEHAGLRDRAARAEKLGQRVRELQRQVVRERNRGRASVSMARARTRMVLHTLRAERQELNGLRRYQQKLDAELQRVYTIAIAKEKSKAAVALGRDRLRVLLAVLRAERQELLKERSRRQHAEQALSRSEQRHVKTREDLQDAEADIKYWRYQLAARPPVGSDVVAENRVAELEGALRDQQQLTADRTRERDMARGEAISAWALMDRTHTLLTRAQTDVFRAKRLAREWGIDFYNQDGAAES